MGHENEKGKEERGERKEILPFQGLWPLLEFVS